jgi:MFS family permease
VPYHLQGLALGYLVSGASLGAAAGAILAGPLADRFGRKALLVIDAGIYAAGSILSAVTWHASVLLIARTLIAALGLAALSGTLRLVVIMIGLDFFIASFAVGVGGTGWTLQGEVFPTAVRGQAAAFCAMIDWLANFLIIEIFPVTQNAISLAGVLVIFAGLAALAIVFVWKFLPETKELPVEEIVRVFEKQQEQSVLHKVA